MKALYVVPVHVVIDGPTHLLRFEPAKSTNAKLSLEMTKKLSATALSKHSPGALMLWIAPDYLIPSQMIKEIEWPDAWLSQEPFPSLDLVWDHISVKLPLIHEGWRREILSGLLRETVLGYTSPLRI